MYQFYGSLQRNSLGFHWPFLMFSCSYSIGFCSGLHYFLLFTLSLIFFLLVREEDKFWFRFFIFNCVSILWPIFPPKHCFCHISYILIYCIFIFIWFKVLYNFPCKFFFNRQVFLEVCDLFSKYRGIFNYLST